MWIVLSHDPGKYKPAWLQSRKQTRVHTKERTEDFQSRHLAQNPLVVSRLTQRKTQSPFGPRVLPWSGCPLVSLLCSSHSETLSWTSNISGMPCDSPWTDNTLCLEYSFFKPPHWPLPGFLVFLFLFHWFALVTTFFSAYLEIIII